MTPTPTDTGTAHGGDLYDFARDDVTFVNYDDSATVPDVVFTTTKRPLYSVELRGDRTYLRNAEDVVSWMKERGREISIGDVYVSVRMPQDPLSLLQERLNGVVIRKVPKIEPP
jgi:hypothetical protein